MIVIGNKCHHVLCEVKIHKDSKAEYIILYNNDVVYWRPDLKNIGMEYTRSSDIPDIISNIKSRKYRNHNHEERKVLLLNYWSELYNMIRDFKINLVTSPIVEHDIFSMFA